MPDGFSSAPPFIVPLSLTELEVPPEDDEHRLFAQKVVDLETLQPDEVEQLVKGLAFDLADKEVLCVEEQDIFDQIYSLVKGFPLLEPAMRGSLIESLTSNFSVLLPNITSLLKSSHDSSNEACTRGSLIHSHRNAFRIYAYFIQSIAFAEETRMDTEPEKPAGRANGKAKQNRKKHLPKPWDWEAQRARIIRLLATAIDEDLKHLFGAAQPEETLLAYIAKGAFSLLSDPSIGKDKDTMNAIFSLIGACSTKYHYVTQTAASILHLLHKYEHLPVHLAEAVAYAEKKYHDGSLALALIREIGRLNPKDYARDGMGADNVGKFLVELAEHMPRLVTTNVGVLMPHFGGESYKIRSALISVFGKLVSKASKETDVNAASETSRLRSKQAMIDVMMERSRDTSAYTRSKVLQTWAELCEEHALSIGLWNQVADMAAGRLEDKAAIVRKSALQLLTTLLQFNPFGPQLRTAAFEATLEKYKTQLESMTSQNPANEVAEATQPNSDLEQSQGSGAVQGLGHEGVFSETEQAPGSLQITSEPTREDTTESQMVDQTQSCLQTSDVGGIEQTRALVASLEAGLYFTKCIASTMSILVQLLASSNASDVEYTIQLLMCARQFNIDGAESCLQKMLPLIFSQERAIHDAVETAFYTIYVKKNPFETAMNLINLTMEASIGDLASMEEILRTLVRKGDISQNAIVALWDFFTFNAPGATVEQSRGALVVLSMVAKSSPKILSSHLQNVVDIGFGRWAKEDMLLARTACNILQQLSGDTYSSLLSSHKVFNNLVNVILSSGLPEESWYAAAEQAINAVYVLHPMPEDFSAKILRKFYSSAFNSSGLQIDEQKSAESSISVISLSRFLFLVGHIALKQFVYIESCVRKIRRQRTDKERAAAESQGSLDCEPDSSMHKEENISDELGVAASEDARIDILQERAEKDIVSGGQSGKYLIGVCAPLVAKVARNVSLLQEYPMLQCSVMLALSKLMVLDEEFCEQHLQLLFTVAQNAQDDTVRSNCIIALGDLTVRFPNLLEPWTEHIYARLHDQAQSVRKNAVLVLSHLILNDMMKVKGHITEMTLRLEDEDLSISNSVKLFFHELSKKGNNPIYNLLPDILSRLSNMRDLQQEKFNNIMQFLIGSIKKDKQMEGLIEKLCHRFVGSTDPRQWQNIAYCLSQLTFTDKGIKKLADQFKCYEHALAMDAVVTHFKAIISKAKKFVKAEVKVTIDEFEQKVIECHEERKEQEATMQNALSHLAAQVQSEELLGTDASNEQSEDTGHGPHNCYKDSVEGNDLSEGANNIKMSEDNCVQHSIEEVADSCNKSELSNESNQHVDDSVDVSQSELDVPSTLQVMKEDPDASSTVENSKNYNCKDQEADSAGEVQEGASSDEIDVSSNNDDSDKDKTLTENAAAGDSNQVGDQDWNKRVLRENVKPKTVSHTKTRAAQKDVKTVKPVSRPRRRCVLEKQVNP
ncbi:hypothetical protein KP509_08G005100 [Ceratopteris richardii]|uniref:Condensin-1 complex subunit CAP-D2 n=3 Tax=Ceratopteris richardii TaxID=49495 RepID=A0A8T2U9Y5_CERRI|nr:hypothetical protein KP509_08G005100 [Ceratopteris richardii]KAH7430594.1 hypothetical protein KP509_08G005100 [Ceratopteris richardii]